MHCVVMIPELNAIYFLIEVPANRDDLEREGMKIVEGASVEVPSVLREWPIGTPRPEPRARILGVSRTDPKRFKEFEDLEEAEEAGFESTGMIYAGAYSPWQWERLAERIPSMKAFEAIHGNERPGAMDEAMRYIREGR